MSIHPDESDRADRDEKPVLKVSVSKPFHIGATQVTEEQYRQFFYADDTLRAGHAEMHEKPTLRAPWEK